MSILIPRVSTLLLVCTKGNFLCYFRLCLTCVSRAFAVTMTSFRLHCYLDVGCYYSSFSVFILILGW